MVFLLIALFAACVDGCSYPEPVVEPMPAITLLSGEYEITPVDVLAWGCDELSPRDILGVAIPASIGTGYDGRAFADLGGGWLLEGEHGPGYLYVSGTLAYEVDEAIDEVERPDEEPGEVEEEEAPPPCDDVDTGGGGQDDDGDDGDDCDDDGGCDDDDVDVDTGDVDYPDDEPEYEGDRADLALDLDVYAPDAATGELVYGTGACHFALVVDVRRVGDGGRHEEPPVYGEQTESACDVDCG